MIQNLTACPNTDHNISVAPDFPATYWLFLFMLAHLIGWTLVPLLVRHNLPLDAIEGTLWGHQLEWGYDKNPFLNGWLTALAIRLGGPSGGMIYLFSQLSVITCFWAVWKLASRLLSPIYALISVMMLEGIQYYHFHAIDFNDNTLELGLWALGIYFFYQALRDPSQYAWILTGLFAALSMMAKYYTAALLTAMILFFFSRAENRKQLRTRLPYLGLLTFFIIILPHVIWLFFHDFITVTYVFQRASSPPDWTNHFFFPAQFAWQQLEAFLPALALFALLWLGKKSISIEKKIQLPNFDQAFLFYVGLGPFLLTLLLSLVFGIKLRAGWGMPLLSLWSVFLIAHVQPSLTYKKCYGFITVIFTLMGILWITYSTSLIYPSTASSANFPGRDMATQLTIQWHNTYHTKLAYLAGSRWIGGNIAFYSKDHPAVFVEWNQQRAPWIDINDMKKKGAIFVWDINNDETLPKAVQTAFPTLQLPTILTFKWRRNPHLAPISIGMALLPPSK